MQSFPFKRFLLTLGGVVLLISIAVTGIFVRVNGAKIIRVQPFPSPAGTVIVDSEKYDQYGKRREWIESMHRAAPGVDRRAADRETRRRKSLSSAGFIQGTWKEIGSQNQAGRIHAAELDTSNSSIYCASSGGNIWRGDLNGNNWQVLNDQLQMEEITTIRAVPLDAGQRLLVSSRSGFYYSDDDGDTWHLSVGPADCFKAVVANDAAHTLYVTAGYRNPQVFRSTDNGETFTFVKSFNNILAYAVDTWTDYYEDSGVFLAAKNRVYRLDGSQNPEITASIPVGDPEYVRMTGCRVGGNVYLYILAFDSQSGRSDIYGSDDGGKTWSHRGAVHERPFKENSFSCSAVNPNDVYMGGVNCYRSRDGGVSWTMVNSWDEYYQSISDKLHADICGINSFKDGSGSEYVLISTDGGIYISMDSLQSVRNLSLHGLHVGQYYSIYSSRQALSRMYAGSQDQGFQVSDSAHQVGPAEFLQTISGDYGGIVSGDEGESVWAVYPGFVYYYDENSTGHVFSFPGSGYLWMPPLMADPTAPNKVYLGGGGTDEGAYILHITYSGPGDFSYTQGSYDFSKGKPMVISTMAYSPIDPDYRYVMTHYGAFYYSTDGGESWTLSPEFSGSQSNYFYGASVLPSTVTLGQVYVAGSGYSNPPVYRSDDNGETFVPMDSGLPNTMVYQLDAADEERFLFAAAEVGPYIYSRQTDQWYDLSDGAAPDQVYRTVDYISAGHTVRFGTYGRGIWEFTSNAFVRVTLTILAGEGGTTEPAPGTYLYSLNSDVQVTASADDHYIFVNWTGDAAGTANPITITMDSDKSVTANFREILPPADFSGTKVANRSLLLTQYINVLSWRPNPQNQGLAVSGYRIYAVENGQKTSIAQLTGDQTGYMIKNVEKDMSYTYSIAAVVNNREGSEAVINL